MRKTHTAGNGAAYRKRPTSELGRHRAHYERALPTLAKKAGHPPQIEIMIDSKTRCVLGVRVQPTLLTLIERK